MRDYAARVAQQNNARAEALATTAALAITKAGRRIEIAANISSLADASAAIASGAEGIGVFRTEFLFLDRQTAPDEDEQFIAYRDAAAILAGRPLIVRTLDVGGDKRLPYIDQGWEANPYLGWRGIRLCLAQPELFKVQLRAIVRTAVAFRTVKVMLPMIAVLEEVHAAKRLLAEACAEITIRTGHAVPRIETGIMVEVPSSALLAEQFAPEVDFLSIGTNDLTQYTMAAERGNPRVAALSDAAHPAVLRLIAQVIEVGHKYGKWVGVCGELASDPVVAPLLICLGVDELSMTATAIPLIKQIVRTLDEKALTENIPGLLALDSAQAVRARLQELVS
jgi:phosphoenolpyruvate-protein phosphotransferase